MNAVPPSAAYSRPLLAGLGLTLAITAAYLTSFRGVFVFDDLHAIVDNPTIRDPGRLDQILLAPAEGGTIGGRPVVNLTLALNHALGGLDPRGYHAINLLIHVLASLTLFGLVRRTLEIVGRGHRTPPSDAGRRDPAIPPYSRVALPLALAVAALWALHPLQTAAVTYIVQRAESLMGLCYLLTLYCFVRAAMPMVGGVSHPDKVGVGFHTDAVAGVETGDHPGSKLWLTLSFLACLLGMGTKEVMASAPLLVQLYDRIFVAGSWRETWRQRGGFHGALLATWLLLAMLILNTEGRGGSAGFGTTVPWWEYALTQCAAIAHYLRLVLWPHPLVFDYGTPLYRSLAAVAPQAGLLLLLLGATVWALVRKPALGFLGAGFFLILAPSSSFVPVATQTMAEHRLYLPLAAGLTLVGLAAHALAGRRAVVVLLALAAGAGVLTARRNLVYHSELALWTDTVAHRPENPRAHTNLGIAQAEAGRLPEAAARFEEALRLQPDNAATRLNLCDVLTRLGRPADAVPHGEAAVQLEPGSVAAHLNLAQALAAVGRTADAVTHYETVLRLEPGAPEVPGRLAAALYDLGNKAAARTDFAGAIARYRQALALAPDYLPARNNLANALLITGETDEAITHYREVLRLNPGDQRVQENLARALDMARTPRP